MTRFKCRGINEEGEIDKSERICQKNEEKQIIRRKTEQKNKNKINRNYNEKSSTYELYYTGIRTCDNNIHTASDAKHLLHGNNEKRPSVSFCFNQ